MMDSTNEKVTKWYKPEDLNQEQTFKQLLELVKNMFFKTKVGIRFCWITNYLEENGFFEEMVRQVGFETIADFLFHCDELLEVRGKKIGGRIIYFLFLQEKVRRAEEEALADVSFVTGFSGEYTHTDDDDLLDDEVYYQTAFPASFSRILYLHRDILLHTGEDVTNYCVKVKGKEEKLKAVKKAEKKSGGGISPITFDKTENSKNNSGFVDHPPKPQLRLVHAPELRAETAVNRPIVQILRSHVFEQPETPQNRHRVIFR